MKWLCILFMMVGSQLNAQQPPKISGPVILVGKIIQQNPEGTLIEGRIVSSKEFQQGGPTFVQTKSLWVTGIKDFVPRDVQFLVIPDGSREQVNAQGNKETIEQYTFVRIVTKADDPEHVKAEKIKRSGEVYH